MKRLLKPEDSINLSCTSKRSCQAYQWVGGGHGDDVTWIIWLIWSSEMLLTDVRLNSKFGLNFGRRLLFRIRRKLVRILVPRCRKLGGGGGGGVTQL